MTPKTITPEQIKDWLDSIQQNREWLAERCGVTKPTVNGWLSAGRLIPQPKMEIIHGLMHPSPENLASLKLNFDHDEWLRIEEARKLVGSPPHNVFYQDAIIEFSDRLIAAEKSVSKTVVNHKFTGKPNPLDNVAEHPNTPPLTAEEIALQARSASYVTTKKRQS